MLLLSLVALYSGKQPCENAVGEIYKEQETSDPQQQNQLKQELVFSTVRRTLKKCISINFKFCNFNVEERYSEWKCWGYQTARAPCNRWIWPVFGFPDALSPEFQSGCCMLREMMNSFDPDPLDKWDNCWCHLRVVRQRQLSICLPKCKPALSMTMGSAVSASWTVWVISGNRCTVQMGTGLFFISRHMKQSLNVPTGLLESLHLGYDSGWQ